MDHFCDHLKILTMDLRNAYLLLHVGHRYIFIIIPTYFVHWLERRERDQESAREIDWFTLLLALSKMFIENIHLNNMSYRNAVYK